MSSGAPQQRYQNRNARETRSGGGQDITRTVLGKNAIITDGRTSVYQHTSADLIAEAKILQERTAPAATTNNTPSADLRTEEEVAFFRQKKREELETLVQRNFKDLNNWLRYAEWEEGQRDYARARSVYERAIKNHGSRPQLWRQYAEMEMRCPPPPVNKRMAAAEAQSALGDGTSVRDISAAGAGNGVPSAETLAMLGVTSADAAPSLAKAGPYKSSVVFASSSSAATSTTASPANPYDGSSGALMLLPGSSAGSGAASANALALVSLSAIVATPAAQHSQRVGALIDAVAKGGPAATIARVRAVYDRALASLPQCDDLWMKYIIYEATLATRAEDDAAVRALFDRWLQYVDQPHVYELRVDFEVDMAHYPTRGGGPSSAPSPPPAAMVERVEAVLKQLVTRHNTLQSWLFYSSVLERRLNDRQRAAEAVRAACAALGTISKFGGNGALFVELGRLHGAMGKWASEGRAALSAAIAEARAIEEKGRSGALEGTAASAGDITVASSIVSDTLFVAYTALERRFGAHDQAALDKLTLLNHRLAFSSAMTKGTAGNGGLPPVGIDAPNLPLALRLIGCGRDEQRTENARRCVADISSNADGFVLDFLSHGSDPNAANKRSALLQASYVPRGEEDLGAAENDAESADDHDGVCSADAALKALDKVIGGDNGAARHDGHLSATASSHHALDELAVALRAVAEHRGAFKAAQKEGRLGHVSCSTKDAFTALVLGAVDLLLLLGHGGDDGKAPRTLVGGVTKAKELVSASLDLFPCHGATLWATAARLEVKGAALNAKPSACAEAAERVRKIYGAAIANLSAAGAASEDALSSIYDSYIGFEKAVGGFAAASSGPDNNPPPLSARLLLSMGPEGGALAHRAIASSPSSSAPSSTSPAAEGVRRLYMEALKRFRTAVPWWVSFASFELSLRETDRCFKLLEKAEGVLKAEQSRVAAAAEAASSTSTATKAAQQQCRVEEQRVRSHLDSLRGFRVGLLLQAGRGEAALEVFVEAVRVAMAEYTVAAVATVEAPLAANPTANTSVEAAQSEALIRLPAYARLGELLRSVPPLAHQMYALAAPSQTEEGRDSGKKRGDDAASKAYSYVSALYRTLAVELRKSVAAAMAHSNVPLANRVVEPYLAIWRVYEGRYGSAESAAAVSCSPSAPSTSTSAAAPPTEGSSSTDANLIAPPGKKRRRLADLAEKY